MADILLVDDDEQLRPMLKLMLEAAGHEVQDARNGKEALKIIGVKEMDLVVTDLVMPEKEGLETIKEIRRTYPGIKIIAMSGVDPNGTQSYLELARKLGAHHTLCKPFSELDMLESIQMVMSGESLRQAK